MTFKMCVFITLEFPESLNRFLNESDRKNLAKSHLQTVM